MRRRAAAVLLLWGSVLGSPSPGWADAAIARRLAALQALVEPERASRGEARAPERAACAGGAWWRGNDYALRERIDSAVRDASLRFGVESSLIRAVIRVESAGNVDAISSAGAMGLMQLMPATARELGVVCAYDPRQNVMGGTRYLRQLRDRLGSWPRALAGYHAGPRRVEEDRLPAVTRRYVRDVLRRWR